MQPVAENAVGTLDRARLQLLNLPALRQLREPNAAEKRRAERLDLERNAGVLLRALGRSAGETPPPFVPRTERVAHVEHKLAVLRIGTARQRGTDVDEPHPQAVAEPVAHPPRLREDEEERMVGRHEPRRDRG